MAGRPPRRNGSVGEAIGHTLVQSEGGFKTNRSVQVDPSVWREWTGARTVRLVLHNANGDGEFDPADDPILTSGGDPVAATITVERAAARATVGTERFHAATTNGTVTVRTVQLPADGLLALRDGSPDGAVVGTTALSAGTHHNVTVELNESFYREQGGRFRLSAVLYRDDGDGTLGDADGLLTAGSDPIATAFHLKPADPSTPTATPTATDTNTVVATSTATDDGHGHEETTATDVPHDDTTTTGDGHDDHHETTASGGTTTRGGSPTDTEHDHAHSTTNASGPGFGAGVAALALAIAVVAVRRLRRT